jgi:hypothetical protein
LKASIRRVLGAFVLEDFPSGLEGFYPQIVVFINFRDDL